MKAADIVTQLRILLPQLTDLFTDNVGVLSITRAGIVLTVQCDADHGFLVGNAVAIAGATTIITAASLTRAGEVGTIVTDADHDLTNPIAETITISGANESEFTGTFAVINVDNRRTIQFEMVDAGPTTATGAPVLENAESQLRQYNGTYRVETVPTPSSFTIEQQDTDLLDPIGNITAGGNPRISSGVNPQRMVAAYTEKEVDEYWLFVGLEDVTASKSRAVRSDAIDNLTAGDNFRQQIIQPFSLYLFVPSQDQLSAADARDQAEELFRPLCQSVLASKFDSGLSREKLGAVQFVLHGTFQENSAVYVHGYNFQQVVDLYEQDTVGPDLDVAFRNLLFSSTPELPGLATNDVPTLDIDLNLDDVPLP